MHLHFLCQKPQSMDLRDTRFVIALIYEAFDRIVNISHFDYVVLAKQHDRLVGCAVLTEYTHYVLIQCLCVLSSQRKQGIGEAVLSYIRHEFEPKQLVLEVNSGATHDRLVRFYERNGFRICFRSACETRLCSCDVAG